MDEFAGADVGDARLSKRLIKLADRLGDAPSASIPGACNGRAETQAAYRLFDQARADKRGLGWEDVLAPQRLPLGLVDAWMWVRPLEASESRRWIEGYERLAECAGRLPTTRLVYVADREADMLELMQRAHTLGHPADYLLRAQHNRCLPQNEKLWPAVLAAIPLGEIDFTLPERPNRPARSVRQTLHARTVDLPDGHGGTMPVSCLIARESGVPQGQKAVEWRLLTNRIVATVEDAAQLIDWYRCRWEIETLFHVLKNGCRVESLQFGHVKKLELALAIDLVVAWRLAHLTRLGRIHPELPASVVFEQTEWQAAWLLAEKPPPRKTPTLREVIHRIAMLGGFLARKGDGEPGVKTLWQGFARLSSFVRGVEQMRQGNAL